jgi:hypothetical protein
LALLENSSKISNKDNITSHPQEDAPL